VPVVIKERSHPADDLALPSHTTRLKCPTVRSYFASARRLKVGYPGYSGNRLLAESKGGWSLAVRHTPRCSTWMCRRGRGATLPSRWKGMPRHRRWAVSPRDSRPLPAGLGGPGRLRYWPS
jgi:hypothetical protein